MSTANVVMVENVKCSACKGRGRWQPPGFNGETIDCEQCHSTGNVEITYMDDNTMRAPLAQFMNHGSPGFFVENVKVSESPTAFIENAVAQPGTKPKSGEILTDIMEKLIQVTTSVSWLNFENDVPGAESIERQLWDLRGTLGDYVHALREEAK